MEAMVASQPVIKVAAICGSLRKASFNRGLIRSGTLLFSSTLEYFFSPRWVVSDLR